MSDYQQIPGSIRSLLATKSQTWTQHAVDLATQYALLCDETNQRLRRCAEYLRRGMWSAATHLADCQPNLVQAVASLEFPERPAWADLCVTNGMAAPAILETACLEKLKVAYEREKVLQPLLSRQRLLAIAKAPTRARLEVARLLASEDPDNTAWSDEILSLESVRLLELQTESRSALQTHNEAASRAVQEEVTHSSWRREIPEGLVRNLEETVADISAQHALAEIRTVAADLVAALNTDPPVASIADLIKRWETLTATPGVVVPPDLQSQVLPILTWHAGEKRRKDVVDEVKPLQHVFESTAEAVPARRSGRKLTIVAIVIALLASAAGICYRYLPFFKK